MVGVRHGLHAEVAADAPRAHVAVLGAHQMQAGRSREQLLAGGLVHEGLEQAAAGVEAGAELFVLQHHGAVGQLLALGLQQMGRIVGDFLFAHGVDRVAHGGHVGFDEHAHEVVIPVAHGLVVAQLERHGLALVIHDLQTVEIAGVVPDGQLGQLMARHGRRVEHGVDANLARAALGIGHAGVVGDAVAHTRALGHGAPDAVVRREYGGVHIGGELFEGLGLLGLSGGDGFGQLAHGELAALLHAGAGEDVVEVGEQRVLPGLVIALGGEGRA